MKKGKVIHPIVNIDTQKLSGVQVHFKMRNKSGQGILCFQSGAVRAPEFHLD